MDPPKLLLVDDDRTFRVLLGRELESRGFGLTLAESVEEAKARVDAEELDLAVVDIRLGAGDGLDVLAYLKERQPRVQVLMLTGHGTLDTSIRALRDGAFDYLRKPCPALEIDLALRRALEHQKLVERNAILRRGLANRGEGGEEMVAASDAMKAVRDFVQRVAPSEASILVLGETGVGKEVVARMVHDASLRASNPFVVVDCASLHHDLLQNELFGHERGSFTGANAATHGLFEVADGGTLFLDEVGEIQPEMQVRLLRVLESGRFRRLGGVREIQVNVRIVAATNRELKKMLSDGGFRRDLFYRLDGIRVDVPPLRDRPADITALASHFLRIAGARAGRSVRFAPETLQSLLAYRWPGNVRELRHVVERALILAEDSVVRPAQLPPDLLEADRADDPTLRSLAAVERAHIERVLSAVGGNRHHAAEILEIGERTLYRKIREYEQEPAPQ